MSAQYPQPPSNAPPPNEPPPPLNEPEAPPPGPSIPPPAVLPPYQPPDPKSYLDVAPSYELPSYSSGDTAARREYWNIEAPDEQIPDYVPRTSTGSATASTRRTEIDASQLAEAFRRSFRTARILAVVLAIAAVASSAAGAANAYAARSTGLWAAVGIAATDLVLSVPLLVPSLAMPTAPGPVPRIVRYAIYFDTAMMAAYLAAALLSPYCFQGDSACGVITISRFVAWICCLVHLWCLLVEMRARKQLVECDHWS